jgi:hypothetical protein
VGDFAEDGVEVDYSDWLDSDDGVEYSDSLHSGLFDGDLLGDDDE